MNNLPFKSFNLRPELLKNLSVLGYEVATSVQEKVIPLALQGKSLVVKSPTGSGKTHSFLIPLINNLTQEDYLEAVILVPSNELGNQTYEFLAAYNKLDKNIIPLKILSTMDIKRSGGNGKILVTTPELFIRAIQEKVINAKNIKTIVLDEADMLIFGGFVESLTAILEKKKEYQVLVFTATIDTNLKTFIKKFIGAHIILDLGVDELTSASVTHYAIDIRQRSINEAIVKFLHVVQPYKCMIFSSTKENLIKVYNFLNNANIKCVMVHGDLEQRERKNAIRRFKNDEVNIILGSDVLARGVDIDDVSDVVSLDLPKELTYYFHRAGRTGRNGKIGNSYVFYTISDSEKLAELRKKGVNFKSLSLRDEEIRNEEKLNVHREFKKSNNVFLEKEIKKEIFKLKKAKVKPNYKKKIRLAITRAKDEHKQHIIRTNIRKKKEASGE